MGLFDGLTPDPPQQSGGLFAGLTPDPVQPLTAGLFAGLTPDRDPIQSPSRAMNFGAMNPDNPGEFLPTDEAPFNWITVDNPAHPFHKNWKAETGQNMIAPETEVAAEPESNFDKALSMVLPYYARHPQESFNYWTKKMDQIEQSGEDPFSVKGASDRIFAGLDIASKMLSGHELLSFMGDSTTTKFADSFGRAGSDAANGAYYLTKMVNRYTTIPGWFGADPVGDYILAPVKEKLNEASARMSEIAPDMARIGHMSAAVDRGDYAEAFKTIMNEPTGVLSEGFQMMGGQLAAIIASGGAGGIAGIGAATGLFNVGGEVQASIESGNYKDIDDAIEAGLFKAGIQTAGDVATGGLAKYVPLFKGATADIIAKGIAGTGIAGGTLWGSRTLVGEETKASELAMTFGVGALFETPAIMLSVGKFGTGADTLAQRLDDPSLLGPGQTEDTHVMGVQRLLELMERKLEVEDGINKGTLRTASQLGLLDESVKQKLDDIFLREDQARVDANAPGLTEADHQFLKDQARGNLAIQLLQPETADFIRMGEPGTTFAQMTQDLPVTLSAAGRLDVKAKTIKEIPLQKGQVLVSLNSTLLPKIREKYAAMEQMKRDGASSEELGGALAEIKTLERREALAIDTWRTIQKDLAPMLRAFDKDAAVVLTDRFSTGAKRDEPGAAIFHDVTPKGMKRIVLGFDPATFFRMDGEPGKKKPVFDRGFFTQTIARQLGRHTIAQVHGSLDEPARRALGVEYQKYLSEFGLDPDRALSDELAYRGSVGPARNPSNAPMDYADFAAIQLLRDPKRQNELLKTLGPMAAKMEISVPQLQDYIKASQALINERRRVAQGGTDYTVTSPLEPSHLWQRLVAHSDGGTEITLGNLREPLRDKNLPIHERKALARTLRQFDIDNPQGDQNKVEFPVSRLAAAYDQNLRWEIAKRDALKERSLIGSLFQSSERAIAKLDAEDQKIVDSALGSFTESKAWMFRFLDILQFEHMHPYVPALRKFTQDVRDLGAWRYGHLYDADQIARQFSKLHDSQQLKVSEWMHHESKYGDTLSLLRKDKISEADEDSLMASGLSRQQIAELKDASEEARTKHLKETFGLSDEAYEAGMAMRRLWARNLNEMERGEYRLLAERHERKEISRETLEEITTRTKRRYANLRRNPYVASMRFGDHLLRVVANEDITIDGQDFKAGDTISLTGYESAGEYRQALRDLDEEFGQSVKLENAARLKLGFNPSDYIGMPMSLFYQIKDKLTRQGVPDAQIQQIEQVVRSYAPDSSFSKRMMRKSHTDGASDDLRRAFVVSNEQFANYYGKVFYGNRMQKHLDDLELELRQNIPEERDAGMRQQADRLVSVHKGMRAELDHILSTESSIGSKLKTAINLNYFALVGRTAVANLAQGVAMYSDLSAKYGDAAASRALAKATADVGGRLTKLNADPYSPLQEQIRQRLIREGTFSHTFIADMVDLSSRSLDYHLSKNGKRHAAKKKLKDYGKTGWMLAKRGALAHLNLTDAWMREAQAMATVDLMEKAGVTDPDIVYKQTMAAIEGGSFKHEREYRPYYSRGAAANVMLAFTNIIQKSLFLGTLRKDGTRARFILGTMMMGGLTGLFGAEDGMELINLGRKAVNSATGEYGVPDTELEFRNFLLDHELPADFLMKGFSGRSMGLHDLGNLVGLNIPKVDMHASVSMGRLIPFNLPNAVSRMSNAKPSEMIGTLATNLAGPAGGMVQQAARAWNSGDIKQALPYGIQNMWYLNPDQRTVENSRGQPIYVVENDAERFALALGMRSPELEDKRDLIGSRLERESYWRGMKTTLAHKFAEAMIEHYNTPTYEEDAKRETKARIERVMEEITRFNQAAPHPTYMVQRKSWESAIKTQIAAERRSLYGLGEAPKNDRSRAFPEVVFPELRAFDPAAQRREVDNRIRDFPVN